MLRLCVLFVLCVALARGTQTQRIINGTAVQPGTYPNIIWQVALSIGERRCGGSIVASQWVITAAHCVRNLLNDTMARASTITVVTGTNATSTPGDTFGVAALWIHPTYQTYMPLGNRIDVAMLKLDRGITFTSRVGSIALCASSHCFSAGTVGFVSGYGATQSLANGVVLAPSPTLLYASQQIVDGATCRNASSTTLSSSTVCAGAPVGVTNVGACTGDDGGPLSVNTGTVGIPIWALSGIALTGTAVSGVLCGASGTYTTYTSVYGLDPWMTSIIAGTGGAPADCNKNADLNRDSFVNAMDVSSVVANWGVCNGTAICEAADLNCDGRVSLLDLVTLMEVWKPR